MLDYLDTSAFLKLVRSERESAALRHDLASAEGLVSSLLLQVEALRAAARYGRLAVDRTRLGLSTITLLPIDVATVETAATLDPPVLRSLDALHLASALSIGNDLGRLYCYDGRLAAAASSLGLDVRGPA